MTREQIRNKYGITQLAHPSIVNKELSEEEAAGYEKIVKMHVASFSIYWNDDFLLRMRYQAPADHLRNSWSHQQPDKLSVLLCK